MKPRTPPDDDKPCGAPEPPGDHLNWRDPAAVSRWLVNLRVALDDADSVTVDMLKTPRRRDLGPRLHRREYRAARASVRQLLAYADPAPPEPEPGDPAGCGGSPAH